MFSKHLLQRACSYTGFLKLTLFLIFLLTGLFTLLLTYLNSFIPLCFVLLKKKLIWLHWVLVAVDGVGFSSTGLSRPTGYGILVPQPGIKLESPALDGSGPAGKSLFYSFH